MAVINQLREKEAQKRTLTVAFGRQAVTGMLAYSKYDGTRVACYNALGEGEWDSYEQLYYKGVQIPAADANFHTGALATGMLSGPQQVDPLFDKDVPHSRTAAIGYKVPTGLADSDTEKNPPEGFKGIFKTKKVPNFNSSGTQTAYSYSANPARCVIELLNNYSRLPNIPAAYAGVAEYWASRIDWPNWCDWRDYCDATETVDYTTLTDFDGIGLTASFFSDTTLTTLARKFIQPSIDSQGTASAPPVYGVAGGNFSARFEGKIRPKYSETYTFYVKHDDGAKLWVNGTLIVNEWASTGTHSGTIALTGGTLYDIKLEWKNGSGNWDIRLEWQSASQPRITVAGKYLYPVAESRPRYESHVYFSSPTNVSQAIRTILFVTNSFMQEVNGKLRFYCIEQLTPSFALVEGDIDRLTFKRRSLLGVDPITAYEANMKDLDSNYLEEPSTPVRYQFDRFARMTGENVKVVDLFNMTRWQARKVLEMRAKIEVGNSIFAEVQASTARTYPIIAGDLGTVKHRKLGSDPVPFLVAEASDAAVAEGGTQQGTQPEHRVLTMQQWET